MMETVDARYEDNHVIVVVKPHGVPVQSDDSGDLSLQEMVQEYLRQTYKKPGRVFCGIVHRLDRPVGGLVVFAKTSKGAARLSEQFRAHTVQKIYLAVVQGSPTNAEGIVVLWLRKHRATNYVTFFTEETEGSLRAELRYRVLEQREERTLVEIVPTTGRSHQIRVSMQALGCPIVGDVKYGGPLDGSGQLALYAKTLVFSRAVGGERVTVTAEPTLPAFALFTL